MCKDEAKKEDITSLKVYGIGEIAISDESTYKIAQHFMEILLEMIGG